MDASAHNRTRKFPGFTLMELEAAIAAGKGSPAMRAEVEARKSGRSKPASTPQIRGGLVITRIGSM